MGMPFVGRRGRCLLFFGVLDVVYALSLVAPDETTAATPFFVWLQGVCPMGGWAALWGAVGAVCLWSAFRRVDRVVYAAAIGLKVLWGGLCVGGWLFGGVDRGWVSAAIWLGLAYMVSVIAGWPEDVVGGRLVPWHWIRRRS
jgi:hypothetical protein